MKNLEFTEGKKLRQKDDHRSMGIMSAKEDGEVFYEWKNSIVFLQKENHRGWTFSLWVMNERVEVFFSRGNYELVEL